MGDTSIALQKRVDSRNDGRPAGVARSNSTGGRGAVKSAMSPLSRNLSWDDFRLVKAIADARGLPGAAAQMGVNHSTVFRRLAQIEELLGATLFERRRAGYALTPAGEAMVALATRVEEDILGFTRKLAGQEFLPS